MGESNDRLRAARERVESPHSTGQALSRVELADLVNQRVYADSGRVIELNANYIGKLERGQIRWPQNDYRAGLRAVLGVGTDAELGFSRPRRDRSTVKDVDRKDFLRVAIGVTATTMAPRPLADLVAQTEPTPVPSVVGEAEIEQVRIQARVFSSWDHTYGGGLVREAVSAQLRYAVGLLHAQCAEAQRRALYGAVGFLGHTAGFMAFDAYAHEDARRCFRLALSCAEEADDWRLRAKVLSSMARQAIWCGDPDTGLTLTELAMVRADRLTPTERAMLFAARARALGKLRRVQEVASTIGMADEEFAHASPGDDPAWMAYYDAAQHSGDTGHALYDLAVRGHFVTDARERLSAAVAGHSAAYARSRAISGIKLASLTMVTGDPLEAANVGSRALGDAGKVRSRRAADDLRELRGLAEPHIRLTEVGELCSRIGTVVATA